MTNAVPKDTLLDDTFLDGALEKARALAVEAGELILEYYDRPEAQNLQFKGVRDPLTEADLRSEAVIREGLQKSFPDHTIVAEEEGRSGGESPFRWYVDPLDGTVNFAHGLPIFAVSIALAYEDEPVLGVTHLPKLEETYTARRGGGAFFNGRAIEVSKTDEVAKALVSTGFHYRRHELKENNVREFDNVVLKVRGIRRIGVAAFDLACVAAGRFDGHWELHLAPWDIAAGIILVREAGGVVTDAKGGPCRLDGGSLLATNGGIHEELRGVLAEPGR